MKIKVDIPSAGKLIQKLGIDETGDAQRFHTMNISRRIGKYMPHLTGALETKLKRISSPTEIAVLGPYAKYQYYGKKMVNAETGKGPALIPGVGYRYRKGTILKATDKNLEYTTTFNENAGPYWDRALMAAEGDAIREDLQRYINRRRSR